MLKQVKTASFYRMCNSELTLAYAIKGYVDEIRKEAVALIQDIEAALE